MQDAAYYWTCDKRADMTFARVNGVDLFYEVGGQGSAAVYVHGGFASLDTVLRNVQPDCWGWENEFAKYFQFVTYDRRGCYRSSSPTAGYELANQVLDLTCLLDHLKLPRAHVIGSSAGGPLAILLAATRPQCVRSLVLVGTAVDLFPAGESGSDQVRQHLAILEKDGEESAFSQRPAGIEVTWGELWNQPEAVARGEEMAYSAQQGQWRDQARALPMAQRVHYYATELRSMQAYLTLDLRPVARSVVVPTYVIHGGNDQMVPLSSARELAQLIPSARFHEIPGGPHSLMIRDADARQHVIAFMQTVDACLVAGDL